MALLPTFACSQKNIPVAAPQEEKAAEVQTPQKPVEVTIPEPVAEPAEAESAPSPEAATSYTIKRGDTLWDISNTFYRDPFLWPFIWKANPYITNPDLIYPGNKLAIPSLAPIERGCGTGSSGNRRRA
jgi:nucleoid-associated protein YgaU